MYQALTYVSWITSAPCSWWSVSNWRKFFSHGSCRAFALLFLSCVLGGRAVRRSMCFALSAAGIDSPGKGEKQKGTQGLQQLHSISPVPLCTDTPDFRPQFRTRFIRMPQHLSLKTSESLKLTKRLREQNRNNKEVTQIALENFNVNQFVKRRILLPWAWKESHLVHPVMNAIRNCHWMSSIDIKKQQKHWLSSLLLCSMYKFCCIFSFLLLYCQSWMKELTNI